MKKGKGAQQALIFDEEAQRVATEDQQYELAQTINSIRNEVDRWRALPDQGQWRVTPETARLLHHWRHHRFNDIRPFFCQVEAVETAIWLTEVAPSYGNAGRRFLDHLERANGEANPDLARLALKLATGAGKTTVMAMLIAWQTINAVRRPSSRRFTRGFLVVTPGITIKDRLRVLQPNDPDSYYRSRELVPGDLLGDLDRAKIVITNFHAFKLRETMEVSKGGRALLQGRGPDLRSLESEGQMLQRVMPELMGMRNVLALNDEAHHCYREKPGDDDEGKLTGDDRKEAEKNREAARLWISGLEAVGRKLGLARVIDLSATPFFLRGSGYAEGTLFPWTMSDFSLMDAIECGIVKLPRVPVADNIPGGEMPKFRNLWEHIRKDMPKKGSRQGLQSRSITDSRSAANRAAGSLRALREDPRALAGGRYRGAAMLHRRLQQHLDIQTWFTTTSPASSRENPDGSTTLVNGRFELFRNFDDYGTPLPRPPHTADRQRAARNPGKRSTGTSAPWRPTRSTAFGVNAYSRTGDIRAGDNISDQDLLREVMNTVGKREQLGETIRCVVSVSMLTEGWDANTVTHVLGVRAFGTQLLCEQAVGRALRRQSYELNDDGVFPVEYADVLGIPFDFTARPVVAPPQKPRNTVLVRAVTPERDRCEIRFPRVQGYRIELPEDRLQATFDADSTLVLTPDLVGPSVTRNEGIIGEGVDLNLVHTRDLRRSTLLFHLTKRLLETKWRDRGEEPKLHLFGQLKRIARQWLDHHLVCKGGTYPAQLMYLTLADTACERITQAIVERHVDERPVKAVLDPYNPAGSTRHVRFTTSKKIRKTDARCCHVNFVVCDSDWEAQFCLVAEGHPRVRSYVKNHGLGLEVPYRLGSELRRYIPDFIVHVDDGRGADDPLHLIVEIKGYRGEDAKDKKATMDTYWVPGVNGLGTFGRWAFAEFTDVYELEAEFDALVTGYLPEDAAA